MSALVELTQFGVQTTSRTVADVFEKEHKDVLRSIDDLIAKKPELRGRNFTLTEETVHLGAAPRTIRFFEMDRDGFTLVAMGFTGVKALDWKLAFIEAFNAMEAALVAETATAVVPRRDPVPDAEPQVMRDYSPALAVIREARQIFPPKAVRMLWPRLGLPSPFGQAGRSVGVRGDDVFGQFLRDCTADKQGERVRSSILFDLFGAWAKATGAPDRSPQGFAREMEDRGFERIASNGIWWKDIETTVTLDDIAGGNFGSAESDGVAGLVDSSVVAWCGACTVDEPDAETRANDLWASYLGWCESSGRSCVNQTRFGRGLSNLGYASAKGGKGYVKRMGIKLVG